MKIPGFGDRTTTTTVDPVTGERVRTVDTGHTDAVHRAGVHDVGRHTVVTDGALSAKDLQRETRDAYERGRREQRAAQKSNPILTIFVVLLAILGVTLAVLAAVNGSFREGGAQFDSMLGMAGEEAREVGLEAQDAAGEAAQDAGAALQQEGAEVERAAETAPR